MLKINVLLFAGLRESAGIGQVSLELPSGSNVSDAVSAAEISTPRAWCAPESLAMALNHEYVYSDQLLSDGDELALIPPVSGGSSRRLPPIVLITNDPIDPIEISSHVRDPTDGAVLVFEGITRNLNQGRSVLYLEYEAYRPMAEKKIVELINQISDRWEIDRVAFAHRVGRVDIGETSMILAVGSAHRRPAFEAASYFVDQMKRVVPIWKKEYFDGGDVWIDDKNP